MVNKGRNKHVAVEAANSLSRSKTTEIDDHDREALITKPPLSEYMIPPKKTRGRAQPYGAVSSVVVLRKHRFDENDAALPM